MTRNVNRIIGLILALLATGYLLLSYQLPTYDYIPIDADVVPKALGWLLLVLSVVLFFSKDQDSEEQKAKRYVAKKDVKAMAGVFGITLIYIMLLEVIGFIVMTSLFVFFCSLFLGYRQHVVNAIVSISFPIFIYSIFVFLLNINLPQGILPL
ncbi:putative tricarboxylic transport membrane protein [Alkalibacillus flavidus]|uniref:Tricarboxylic transport membrane protein n=1 Tax=Alkalibacillus flavidus TaxID=546021 RepID=A0ABV2KUL6_9BACI